MTIIPIFLVTFGVFMAVVAAMSVGVMAKREPISGSCGGLGNIDGVDCACSQEQKDACRIEHEPDAEEAVDSLAYRA